MHMTLSLYLLLDIALFTNQYTVVLTCIETACIRRSNLKFDLIVNNYLVSCFMLHSSATIISNTSSKEHL